RVLFRSRVGDKGRVNIAIRSSSNYIRVPASSRCEDLPIRSKGYRRHLRIARIKGHVHCTVRINARESLPIRAADAEKAPTDQNLSVRLAHDRSDIRCAADESVEGRIQTAVCM